MAEIRLDPINTLMPLGSRSMTPTTEFASYLDEAWSQFTTTTATDSPAPAKAPRDTPGPVERRKEAPNDDGGAAGAGVAAAQQRQAASNESAAAPADAPADEATPAATPNDKGGQQTQPAGDAGGNARETEASQPQTDAQEDVASPETLVTANAGSGSALDVPAEAGQEPAAEGETPAGIELSGTSKDAATETSATPTDTKTPAVGEASNDAPSSEGQGETGNKGENAGNGGSNTEAEKSPGLQEAVDNGNTDGGSESDQKVQPEETAESRSRHGRPATAKDAGKTREPQAADLNHEKAVDAPARASSATGATADAAPTAATVETSPATAPATNTSSVEPIEGVATGTNRATSGEPGARAVSAASGTPEADQAGAVDRARFAQRVAQAFQATGDRGGTIRMRLSPPELGSLRVEITVNRGVMNARMETETDAARQLVLENLPALRERLAEQGIKVEQFQVDVSDRETGGQPNQFEDRSHSDRSDAEPRRHSTPRDTSAQDAESQGDRRARRVGETSRLDVLV